MSYNISIEQLEKMAPFATDKARIAILTPLNEAMNEFNINTPSRIAAFMAQIIHESGSFKYTSEIADGSAYENRKDLGNLLPEALEAAHKAGTSTGKFYKGHGFIQITGFYNHRDCGKALGLDLVNQPELLCEVKNACRSAAWFWNIHNLNSYADVGLFGKITSVINGGSTSSTERLANYARCKKVLCVAV